MKLKFLTLLGIVLLVAGFSMMFIGYSRPVPNDEHDEIPEEDPNPPVWPEEEGQGQGGSTDNPLLDPEFWGQWTPWWPVQLPDISDWFGTPEQDEDRVEPYVPPEGGSPDDGGSSREGGEQLPYRLQSGIDSWTLAGSIIIMLGIVFIIVGGGKR